MVYLKGFLLQEIIFEKSHANDKKHAKVAQHANNQKQTEVHHSFEITIYDPLTYTVKPVLSGLSKMDKNNF